MPFYEYNSFTGGLRESKQFQPLYPLKPVRLDRVELPTIMFGPNTQVAKIAPVNAAKYSSTQIPERILKAREIFQSNPHLPVWLKKGTSDKIWFGLTVLGTGIGLCMSLEYLYRVTDMDKPARK